MVRSINRGELVLGSQVPSLIETCKKYKVSRDTAVKAYQDLRLRGIISSAPGKGYFVESVDTNKYRKLFVLFDSMTPYKSLLYNALVANLDKSIIMDVYFHYFNERVFHAHLLQNKGSYTDYLIMPIVNMDMELLNKLNKNSNLYFIDQGKDYHENRFAFTGQDFKNDLYRFMQKHDDAFGNYRRLVMQIDPPKNPSEESMVSDMKQSFLKYCSRHAPEYAVVDEIGEIREGDCYIVHNDLQLVQLIRQCRNIKLEPGKDLGILSFNENPLKDVVDKGVSTISTDFEQMGRTMANMINTMNLQRIVNPFVIQERNSFKTQTIENSIIH